MDKRAYTPEIKSVILVVLTMIVFILLFQSCTKEAEELSEGIECWGALNAQKLGVQALTGEMVMKACKTIDKKLITDDVSSPDAIKHEIAMNMARAWKITHEGTIKEEMWKTKFIEIFKNGNECMIIYKLRFDPTALFELTYPGFTYQDMDLYFSTEYYASFPRTDGKEGNLRYTFGEYVQSKAGEGTYLFADENDNGILGDGTEIIKPGEVYAISVGSPNSALFRKSKLPTTNTNLLMFSTYQYAIGKEMGCREFVE